MQQDSNDSNNPQEVLQESQIRMFLASPFHRIIYRNKERVLGELATLKTSPLFQYLQVLREDLARSVIYKDEEGKNADLHRGSIKTLDEILNMAQTIRAAETARHNSQETFDRIEKEMQ